MAGFIALSYFLLFLILLRTKDATELSDDTTCEADGSCKSSSENRNMRDMGKREFSLRVMNKSRFRVDVYWDDGQYGSVIMTLEKGGQGMDSIGSVNTFKGHSFFVTRHGVKEALFDPETKKKHQFVAFSPDETFVIPETAAPSEDKCQDRFSICERQAAAGACWKSPGWMIVHCCRSCDEHLDSSRLIDPEIRCSKENLNITDPAWKPGDLNKLFTSWATEERFKEYDPVVLSSPDGAYGGITGPWVMTFDNFLTDEESEALIYGGQISGFKRSTDQGKMNNLGEVEQVVSKTRTSSNAWCREQCERLPGVESVSRKIESVTNIPRKNYESFQILEYNNDQFYRMHHDSSSRDTRPAGPRILTFFLYVSDVEEGGETHFNKLDISVKPSKGKALVWPSVLNDDPGFWDNRMYHEAKSVIQGKKIAANAWIHLNDFVGPNHWGCTGSFS